MVKRARPAAEVPTLVMERLTLWGRCIRKQRVVQKVSAQELCRRLDISRPTLIRMERGEGNVNAALYLAALHTLGVLGYAAPELEPSLWEMDNWNKRVKRDADEEEYF